MKGERSHGSCPMVQEVKQERFKCVINFEARAAQTLRMKERGVGCGQAATFLGGHGELIRCCPLYLAVWSFFSSLFFVNPSSLSSPDFLLSIPVEGDAGW